MKHRVKDMQRGFRITASLLAVLIVLTFSSCNSQQWWFDTITEEVTEEHVSPSGGNDNTPVVIPSTSNNGTQSTKPISQTTQPSGNTENDPPAAKVETVYMKDYAEAGNDSEVFDSALESVMLMSSASMAAEENISYVLKLENKTYRLDRTIVINGANNITIDGNGATLLWTELIRAWTIQNSENLTFKNFSMDYDPLPYTQGVITNIASNDTITILIDTGYRTDVDFLNTTDDACMQVHDPETGSIVPGGASTHFFRNAKSIGSGKVTVDKYHTQPNSPLPKVGDAVSLYNRAESTLQINTSKGTSFIDVNMYSSPGFLFNENGSEGGTLLKNCKIAPGPKPARATKNRLRSANADGLHMGNVKVGPTIDGCTITHTGDDCINIQGFYFHVLRKQGKTITVTPKWDTPWAVGDTVEGYEKDSYAALGTATITKFVKRYDTSLANEIRNLYALYEGGCQDVTLVYDITLSQDIGLKPGDHVTSLDSVGSGTVVKNSTIGFNNGGGIIAKGSNVLIENNTVERTSATPISLESNLRWCESNFPRNSIIRNNVVKNAALGSTVLYGDNKSPGAILVTLRGLLGDDSAFLENYEFRDILIEGNQIIDSRVYAVFATNCTGLTIKNNIITNPYLDGIGGVGTDLGISPKSGIFVGMSKNVTVTGNTVKGNNWITQAVEIHENCSGTILNTSNSLSNN